MSRSAQPHFELPLGTWGMQKLNPHNDPYLCFLSASHRLFEILLLISHSQWLSINRRSLFSSIQRKWHVSFVLILFMTTLLSTSLILGHFLIYLYCHFDAYYRYLFALPPRPPSTLCLQSCSAFTSFHLRPALTLPLVNYVAHYSWLLSRASIGIEGADFNLVTFEQWAPSGGSFGRPDNVVTKPSVSSPV